MVGIAYDSKSCNLGGVKVGLENLHDDTTSEKIELMLPYQYKKSHE